MKRIKDMGLSLNDVYKREEAYINAIRDNKIIGYTIPIDELGLIQCWANNKRKITNPIRDKISIYTVFKYYINLGIVFRDYKKRYYTMEEVEKLINKYYKS
ncbi:Uncharacterised protein [Clostridium baratii]|uniref:hypothetical protein n=1 Tax=Clostridium baratii TaxID=1561 RepID=UPI0006C6699C|nr:hypothetical protein [Clostridium baratii]CUP24500.1 Uncharacterised protein [Clostridium baratii]